MNENKLLSNQAFCIEIQKEDKCHPDLGDGRRSYEDNNFMTFTHGDKFYFVPDADEYGGNRKPMTRARLKELELLFNQEIVTVGELPANMEIVDEIKTAI